MKLTACAIVMSVLLSGCFYHMMPLYLQDMHTGFIYGPLPQEKGEILELRHDKLALTQIPNETLKVINQLKATKICLGTDNLTDVYAVHYQTYDKSSIFQHMDNLTLKEYVVLLNQAQNKVSVNAFVQLEVTGSDFGCSEVIRLPLVITTSDNTSVYDVLMLFCTRWGIRFTIENEKVVLYFDKETDGEWSNEGLEKECELQTNENHAVEEVF